jgi:hypothetical protein
VSSDVAPAFVDAKLIKYLRCSARLSDI